MNKNDFLRQLEEDLLRLSKSDRDDILLDYEEHFRAGEEQGMTEEEVAESLGSPDAIAAQYLENLPADAKGEPVKASSEPETEKAIALPGAFEAEHETEKAPQQVSGGRKFGNVVFWIAAVCVMIFLIYCWVVTLCAVIGMFAGAAALAIGAVAFLFTGVSPLLTVGMLLVATGLVCLNVMLINALKYSMRGLKALKGVFVKTSNKIMGRA